MGQHPLKLRSAIPADAGRISSLYADAYAAGQANGGYPFPQFFDREWVEQAVSQEAICWVIAESGDEVIATVGAVRNIGSEEDRIAEGFGLVVDQRFRRCGVAHRLFRFLTDLLVHESRFVVGEARTAHSGGWRVLRACGYIPIGFEPFAHVTPSGVESMLLTGLIPAQTRQRRVVAEQTTEQVRRFATPVLWTISGQPSDTGDDPSQPTAEPSQGTRTFASGDNSVAAHADRKLKVARDDDAGRRLFDGWPAYDRHASGVVGLRRLEGLNDGRITRHYYVGRIGNEEVSCVPVSWDGLDRRARILDLRSQLIGLEAELLQETYRHICRTCSDEPFTVVVDVRSDAIDLQVALEQVGFRVTAYYPGFIAVGEDRVDAVQYTSVVGRRLADCWRSVGTLDWRPALDIATMVAGSTSREPAATIV